MIDIDQHPLIGKRCRRITTGDEAVIVGVRCDQSGDHALRLAWMLNGRICSVDQYWQQASAVELLELVE